MRTLEHIALKEDEKRADKNSYDSDMCPHSFRIAHHGTPWTVTEISGKELGSHICQWENKEPKIAKIFVTKTWKKYGSWYTNNKLKNRIESQTKQRKLHSCNWNGLSSSSSILTIISKFGGHAQHCCIISKCGGHAQHRWIIRNSGGHVQLLDYQKFW